LSYSAGRRVLFIKPAAYTADGKINRIQKGFFPPRTLPYLAAYLPGGFEARIIDEAVQGLTGDEDADLVVMTGLLPSMMRAMDLGHIYRKRGAKVVLGGIGVFSLYEKMRASGAFDTIVEGESEDTWEQLLDDYQAGRLKDHYKSSFKNELHGLRDARYDLVDHSRYWRPPGQKLPFLAIEASRGCPYACSFCAIRLYFGQKMRFRPVGDVVDEMRRLGSKYYILTDDNVMTHVERAKELFAAIKPLGIRWGGQFDVLAVRHPEVLRLAAESGCRFAGVGVETIMPDNLDQVRKWHNRNIQMQQVVDAFRGAGIAVALSMIFGMDADTPDSLDDTVEQIIRSRADFFLPWVLTPGPGSEIHTQFVNEGRLLHENYSLYNGLDVVFQPRRMTPRQLKEAHTRALHRFYCLRNMFGRVVTAPRVLDALGMGLFFWTIGRQGRHPFSGV